MTVRLIRIEKSADSDKKLQAIFEEEGRRRTVHFGARGMQDYTLTHDEEQRARYRKRHKSDLRTGDPTRAGFLSYYILWGDSTSRTKNIAAYRKRFNL